MIMHITCAAAFACNKSHKDSPINFVKKSQTFPEILHEKSSAARADRYSCTITLQSRSPTKKNSYTTFSYENKSDVSAHAFCECAYLLCEQQLLLQTPVRMLLVLQHRFAASAYWHHLLFSLRKRLVRITTTQRRQVKNKHFIYWCYLTQYPVQHVSTHRRLEPFDKTPIKCNIAATICKGYRDTSIPTN